MIGVCSLWMAIHFWCFHTRRWVIGMCSWWHATDCWDVFALRDYYFTHSCAKWFLTYSSKTNSFIIVFLYLFLNSFFCLFSYSFPISIASILPSAASSTSHSSPFLWSSPLFAGDGFHHGEPVRMTHRDKLTNEIIIVNTLSFVAMWSPFFV